MAKKIIYSEEARAAMGEAGANMLLSLMRGHPPENNCVNLGFELTVRQST